VWLSFRKIVKISMDLSVFSLAFVNSTATFYDASMNLKLKVFFTLLRALIILLSVTMMEVALVSLKRPSESFGADVREDLATG
jgi:hypothetical protein